MAAVNLGKSHYRDGQKSCTRCSRTAGRLVFKNLGEFGWRRMKPDDRDDERLIQPQCYECRKLPPERLA